jgi:hypothetical protein
MRFGARNQTKRFTVFIAVSAAGLSLFLAALSGSQFAMAQQDDGPISESWDKDKYRPPVITDQPPGLPPPINCPPETASDNPWQIQLQVDMLSIAWHAKNSQRPTHEFPNQWELSQFQHYYPEQGGLLAFGAYLRSFYSQNDLQSIYNAYQQYNLRLHCLRIAGRLAQ